MLGPLGVCMFFMIAGYLFWLKLFYEQGKSHWVKLYLGRFFRLYPVNLVAIVSMLLVVAALTGFRPQVPLSRLSLQVFRWLVLGIGQPDVNGYRGTGLLVASVIWSIHWEIVFYLSLPLTAIACRGRLMHLPTAAAGLVSCLLYAIFRPANPMHGSKRRSRDVSWRV